MDNPEQQKNQENVSPVEVATKPEESKPVTEVKLRDPEFGTFTVWLCGEKKNVVSIRCRWKGDRRGQSIDIPLEVFFKAMKKLGGDLTQLFDWKAAIAQVGEAAKGRRANRLIKTKQDEVNFMAGAGAMIFALGLEKKLPFAWTFPVMGGRSPFGMDDLPDEEAQ